MSTSAPAATRKKAPLPNGWGWIRLENLIPDVQSGFACGERDPKGVVQLRMNNVDTRGNLVWQEFIRVPATDSTVARYKVEVDDVLFNNTNSVELVGKSALFPGFKEPVVFSNHFTRLRPDRDRLLPAFLAAWLNHQWNLGVFASICNRWVGQSAVKPDKLLALDFPLPPLPEQTRIAATLNEQMAAVERARQAAEEQREAAATLPAGLLRRAFSKGQLSEWPDTLLGDIADIASGIQKSPQRRPCAFHRPYLTVRNVQRGVLDLSEVDRFEVSPAELDRLRLREGDILIVEGNGSIDQIGRNALFHDDGQEWIHQNHIIRVRLDPGQTLCDFISLFLNSDSGIAQMTEKAQTTSGLYTLSSGKVASLRVPHPPLVVQKEISHKLQESLASARKAIQATRTPLPKASGL